MCVAFMVALPLVVLSLLCGSHDPPHKPYASHAEGVLEVHVICAAHHDSAN